MVDLERAERSIARGIVRPLMTRRAIVRLATGVVVAVVVLIAIARVSNDIPGALEVLSDASLPWILVAIGVQSLCYVLLAFQISGLLGATVGRFLPFRIALVVYGLGTVLPGAPAPGMMIAATELTRRGVEAGRTTLAFFLSAWLNVRSFLILAVLTAFTAVLRGRIPQGSRGAVLAGAVFVVAALALAEAVVKRPGIADRIGRFLEAVNWRGSGAGARESAVRLHAATLETVANGRNGFVIAWATMGSRLADVICLRLSLIAVGIHVSMGIVLIAYVISTIVSIVPFLPGGLGIVEATVPGVLHHYGVSIDAAVAGTVAWRGVTLLLPAIAGLVSYLTLRVQSVTPPAGVPSEFEHG